MSEPPTAAASATDTSSLNKKRSRSSSSSCDRKEAVVTKKAANLEAVDRQASALSLSLRAFGCGPVPAIATTQIPFCCGPRPPPWLRITGVRTATRRDSSSGVSRNGWSLVAAATGICHKSTPRAAGRESSSWRPRTVGPFESTFMEQIFK